MASLFLLLFLISIFLLIIGLVKPSLVLKWGKTRGRGQVLIFYGIAIIVFFVLICVFAPPQSDEAKEEKQVKQQQDLKNVGNVAENTPIDGQELSNLNATNTSTSTTSNNQNQTFKVSRVIDGDTIQLENGDKVRYIGIDTPETVDPSKAIQCFGKEASNKNKELVEGKEVRLVKDVSDKDRYGRLLRYVYVGDLFINLELVKQGYAYSYTYPPDVKFQNIFVEAQKTARENKLGLWSACAENTETKPTQTNNVSTNVAQPVVITSPTVKEVTQPITQTNKSNCLIKGNITTEKIYHLPGCGSYEKTVIDLSAGERWFCTEAEAVTAGWRKAKNCP